MRETAETRAQNSKAYLPQIIADMHCDTLTFSAPFKGEVLLDEITAGTVRCFAAFTSDDDAAAYAAAKTLFYRTFAKENFAIVRKYSDCFAAFKDGRAACALTCENIGFTGGEYGKVCGLADDGVIMASLVWNEENALAYPNVRADKKREQRGLKERGREALAALDGSKIIVDVSHLSDGGADEILNSRKIPVVASHSCCDGVHRHARNLTDGQLKKIADCGGAVGVNFYKKFLGGAGGFKEISAHIKHIISVAGEDTPSFGSDWDGTPLGGIAVRPRNMPELLQFLRDDGICARAIEKLACNNFLRVLKDVRG